MSAGILQEVGGLAVFLVPLACALSWAARLAHRSEGRGHSRHVAMFWCFCIYVVMVATLTLAPPPMSMSNGSFGTNLVPLIYSVRCFVPNPGQPSTTEFCIRTIIGNFAIFLPLGVLLPLVSASMSSWKRVMTVALITSLSIEVLQFVGRLFGSYRWSDVDDVIFNVAGAMTGYWLLRQIMRLRETV